MKAVIMAGGEGSRLRPLTCNLPKPMARLCGKPVIEYIYDLLLRNGIKEAIVTLGYMPNIITEQYENGRYKDLMLEFVIEDKPLGTAGSVKNAVRGIEEPFLVISGDAMCDFDLEKIAKYHSSVPAKATLVASQVNDPREYGLINVDEENKILGFIEKPAWGQATSDLANTGIYILDSDCLDLIPDNEQFDFAKNLFPLMMKNNMQLNCYNATGYWCDIGDIGAYLRCQKNLLDGKIEFKLPSNAQGIYTKDEMPKGNYNIIPPVYIGEQVEIEKNAIIGPFSVIDDCCIIGEGAKIRSSVMLQGAVASKNSSVTGALLCSQASVKAGAAMYEGSVAGTASIIGPGATVKPNILVWPQKCVESYAIANENVKFGYCSRELFDDTGIGGESGIDLTPETCATIGAAIGSIKQCKRVGIACDGSSTAKAMMMALISGLMSAGSHVWSFGDCFETQLSFFTSFCGLGIGIFVSNTNETEIKVCGEGGLTIPRYLEREIETRVARGEFNRCLGESCKDIADMSSIKMMYSREMLKQAPYELSGMCARIDSPNEQIKTLLSDTLLRLNCSGDGCGLSFQINRTGTRVSAIYDDNVIPFEKILVLCCYNEFKNGGDVALPFDAPQVIEALAKSCGCKAYRYLSSPADNSDSLARRLSTKQLWVRDGLFLTVRLLSIIKERDISINELLEEVPEFSIQRKSILLDFPPSQLTKLFGEEIVTAENVSEGIVLSRESGRLLITPSKNGKLVNVLAEAKTAETADELCLDIEKILLSIDSSQKQE